MYTQYKYWEPFVSPTDPCPPKRIKTYATPPEVYIPFQPPGFPQYEPKDALYHGTLWKPLFSPYPPPTRRGEQIE
ncbi:spore coat associated protein CotJA [Virgibacillus siamensis]|uniref:spore coat associated protein CotJA n=1 Tax=Virgibacillus siamensis TaxID=480071 RepID=UPI0009854F0B|nr:spore coat associated protein CotJA [Virgibacillus siamensis]